MYKGSDIRLKSLRKGTRANVFIHLGNIWFPPRPTFLTDKVGFGIMKSSYFFCFTLLRPHLDYWAQERHWITGACPVQYRNDEGSEVSVRGGQNELRWRKEGSGGLIAEYKWGEWMKRETRLAPSYRSRGNKHTFKYMKFYLNTLQENTSIVKLKNVTGWPERLWRYYPGDIHSIEQPAPDYSALAERLDYMITGDPTLMLLWY